MNTRWDSYVAPAMEQAQMNTPMPVPIHKPNLFVLHGIWFCSFTKSSIARTASGDGPLAIPLGETLIFNHGSASSPNWPSIECVIGPSRAYKDWQRVCRTQGPYREVGKP